MAQPSVNRAELRTLVEGSFSAAQIVRLGTEWGLVPSDEWSRSTSDAARVLLREGEKRFGLAECVRRLRIAQPLIEWPAIEEANAAEWGPPSSRGPARDPESTAVATPDAIRAAASPPSPTVAAAPLPEPAPPPPPKPGPFLPFPGTEPEPRRAGLDPKIVLVIGGVVLAIAIVAFGAGFLWSRDPSRSAASGSSSASPSAAGSVRVGPALLAAGLLEDHVVAVASRCSVPYEANASREVLGLAMILCDRKTPPGDSDAIDDIAPTPRSPRTDPDPIDPDEEPRRPRPRPEPADPGPRPAPAPGGGCVSRCKSVRTSCMSACGAEPSDASQYDKYASCTSKCVSAESKCRLSCN
ncbi:MAG: hypothetical protein U0414_31240 [Polyangiaceae bacterium]